MSIIDRFGRDHVFAAVGDVAKRYAEEHLKRHEDPMDAALESRLPDGEFCVFVGFNDVDQFYDRCGGCGIRFENPFWRYHHGHVHVHSSADLDVEYALMIEFLRQGRGCCVRPTHGAQTRGWRLDSLIQEGTVLVGQERYYITLFAQDASEEVLNRKLAVASGFHHTVFCTDWAPMSEGVIDIDAAAAGAQLILMSTFDEESFLLWKDREYDSPLLRRWPRVEIPDPEPPDWP